MITKLEELTDMAAKVGRKKLSVACSFDTHTLEAVDRARKLGFVDAVLTGSLQKISDVRFVNRQMQDHYRVASLRIIKSKIIIS